MLPHTLQLTGQPPPQRIIQPKMSVVRRLRNPGLVLFLQCIHAKTLSADG